MDRSVKTYHARGGRSQPRAKRAVHELRPRYGVEPSGPPLELSSLFNPSLPVVLELGSGMGDATTTMAAESPEIGIVAVEVHTPGVGRLLRKIERENLTNVAVVHGDGIQFIHERIPERSLSGFRSFFPDPWPKKKHHKRRLIRPALVSLIASRLDAGARLHVATDWLEYAEQMVAVVEAEPSFEVVFVGDTDCPLSRPRTRFEIKGIAKGHTITDIVARKK